jgi:hypothetical protein
VFSEASAAKPAGHSINVRFRAYLRKQSASPAFAKNRHSHYAGSNLREQLQPFAAYRIFEEGKAANITARPFQAKSR